MGSDTLAGERNPGFSLPKDFTGTARFAILFSHPFDDLLSRRWSTIDGFFFLNRPELILPAPSICPFPVWDDKTLAEVSHDPPAPV